jgi:type II secretory pathway pseudopilin PulG
VAGGRGSAGFTLLDVCFAVLMFAVAAIALHSSLVSSVSMVRASRENQLATQVMVERLDTIRLYTWDQINTAGYIANKFTVPMYGSLDGMADTKRAGNKFYGTIDITNPGFATSYSNQVRLVTVSLAWTNGTTARRREMSTLVSQYGLQTYIY